jgi:hypothetical protein
MSGVFSMASHSVLQYLLSALAMQLHEGCAHFLSFAIEMNPPMQPYAAWQRPFHTART